MSVPNEEALREGQWQQEGEQGDDSTVRDVQPVQTGHGLCELPGRSVVRRYQTRILCTERRHNPQRRPGREQRLWRRDLVHARIASKRLWRRVQACRGHEQTALATGNVHVVFVASNWIWRYVGPRPGREQTAPSTGISSHPGREGRAVATRISGDRYEITSWSQANGLVGRC